MLLQWLKCTDEAGHVEGFVSLRPNLHGAFQTSTNAK